MGITITDRLMHSAETRHTAELTDGGWEASWLPGHALDRNQAITAMTIAETVGHGLEPGDRLWPAVGAWAAELGLTGPDAVARAAEPETDREAGQ